MADRSGALALFEQIWGDTSRHPDMIRFACAYLRERRPKLREDISPDLAAMWATAWPFQPGKFLGDELARRMSQRLPREGHEEFFTLFEALCPPGWHMLDSCPDPEFCPNASHRAGEEAT